MTKKKVKKFKNEAKSLSPLEVWEALRDNFIYGFLGAILIVFVSSRVDIAVILGYITYYFFLGKVINRPKYVTSIGKFILFPLPAAGGAFTAYKLAGILTTLIL